jgi:hypothetical protein
MKKIFLILGILSVLTSSLFALQDGKYKCALVMVKKISSNEKYKLSDKEIGENMFLFTLNGHIIKQSRDTFKYVISDENWDAFVNQNKKSMILYIPTHDVKPGKSFVVLTIDKDSDIVGYSLCIPAKPNEGDN